MKKISLILTLSFICVCIGTSVAYYNTAKAGYDNANLISFYDGGVYVLDFDINYNKVKKDFNNIKKYIPDSFMPI